MTRTIRRSPSSIGAIARALLALLVAVLVVANLDIVRVNFIAFRVPVPLALLVAALVAAGWLSALRWNAKRVDAQRDRRRRRREMDTILCRRQQLVSSR